MATNSVFIWSKSIPNYSERIEAMGCFGAQYCNEDSGMELAPMEAAKPAPVLTPSEALRPFRHGEVAVWN